MQTYQETLYCTSALYIVIVQKVFATGRGIRRHYHDWTSSFLTRILFRAILATAHHAVQLKAVLFIKPSSLTASSILLSTFLMFVIRTALIANHFVPVKDMRLSRRIFNGVHD